MRKEELDTPSLYIDLDIFERNLILMRDFGVKYGKKLRPHAKTHKCPEIAKRQLECGNCAGVCAAKLSEAEALAEAGIQNILITSPVAAPWKIPALAVLNRSISSLQLAVDDFEQLKMLSAASGADNFFHVLIDADPEMGRTGVPFDEVAVLGRAAAQLPGIIVDGVQCYAGHLQHIKSCKERSEESIRLMQRGAAAFNELKKTVPDCKVFTGTGTGTACADVLIPELTDILVGSYCMMDAEYLGIEHGSVEYMPALRLITSVINDRHSGNVTLDAGTKAIYVTPGAPPLLIENGIIRKDVIYDWNFGDEHGHLTFPQEKRFCRGERLELIVSHCDPTVNLFDELYAVRNGEVVDRWDITLRGCCR